MYVYSHIAPRDLGHVLDPLAEYHVTLHYSVVYDVGHGYAVYMCIVSTLDIIRYICVSAFTVFRVFMIYMHSIAIAQVITWSFSHLVLLLYLLQRNCAFVTFLSTNDAQRVSYVCSCDDHVHAVM